MAQRNRSGEGLDPISYLHYRNRPSCAATEGSTSVFPLSVVKTEVRGMATRRLELLPSAITGASARMMPYLYYKALDGFGAVEPPQLE